MTDLEPLLTLWRDLHRDGAEYVLATVVRVDGSGYRKAGARMLVAADGRRAGTISGGCLEGEVARKAFWHTGDGPVVRRYSTTAEDGEVPFGMGCGGLVWVLLERSRTARLLLERLAAAFTTRSPLAIATVVEGERIATRAYFPNGTTPEFGSEFGDAEALEALAFACFDGQRSFESTIRLPGDGDVRVGVEWCAARPGLFVFGAGDDTVPLVKMARQLGWYIQVADGRSNLATRSRFPEADAVSVLDANAGVHAEQMQPTDAAVLMTHSLEQDEAILASILASILAKPLRYLGVLGPRHRTEDLLGRVAERLEIAQEAVDATVVGWWAMLHAPIGLDLGGETPADIALSVMAEVQRSLHRASGMPLREVRGEASASRRNLTLTAG